MRAGNRFTNQKLIYASFFSVKLALVDAAFAHNCKLLKRSPGHAVVSLPGEGLVEFEVICEKGFSFP
jgi:hypothetical protein